VRPAILPITQEAEFAAEQVWTLLQEIELKLLGFAEHGLVTTLSALSLLSYFESFLFILFPLVYFLWRNSPNRAKAATLSRFRNHTHTHTHTHTHHSVGLFRGRAWQHATFSRNTRPCSRRHCNTQSQQSRGRRTAT